MRIHLPDGMKRGATPGEDPITEILKTCKTIAVVGLSSDAMRPSFGVSEYMKEAGYRMIPVNPNEREVLGEKSYTRLEDVPEEINIVDFFPRPRERAAAVQRGVSLCA